MIGPLQALTKPDIIKLLKEGKLTSQKDILTAITAMKSEKYAIKTTIIKVGDVYRQTSLGNHPCVVISIKKDLVYSLMLTSEESTTGILKKCNSRFFEEAYFTSAIIVSTTEFVRDNFFKTFDNNKEIREVKSILKSMVNSF